MPTYWSTASYKNQLGTRIGCDDTAGSFLKIWNPLNIKASTDGAENYGTYRTCVGINIQKKLAQTVAVLSKF